MKNAPSQYRAFALCILAAVVGVFLGSAVDASAVLAYAGLPDWMGTAGAFALVGGLAHLELVTASATAPGASGAAATALVGDTLTVKNGRGPAHIVALWADFQAAGFVQVVTPSMHDTSRGFRARVRAGNVKNLLPEGMSLVVQPQETLSVTIAGSAIAGDVELVSMLVLYGDLPGSGQRMIDWSELLKRMQKLTTIDVTLAGVSGYSAGEALNAETDLLLANRDYAIIGGHVSAETATIAVAGPDTGNVRVGFPAEESEPDLSINWFPRLSRSLGTPLIPVVNSGNKASTLISMVQDENNITPGATLVLALLD